MCVRLGIEIYAGANDNTDPSADIAAEAEGMLCKLVCGLVQSTVFLQPDRSYKQVMGPSVHLSTLGMNEWIVADRVAARRL